MSRKRTNPVISRVVLLALSLFLTAAPAGAQWTGVFNPGSYSRGQVFNSSGTFTVPSNMTLILVTMLGGGGAGGGGNAAAAAGGGGGSGCLIMRLPIVVTSGQVLTVTVGTGGTAGAAGAAGNGGLSSSITGTAITAFWRLRGAWRRGWDRGAAPPPLPSPALQARRRGRGV